ncbi:MAG: hypothetical protein ACC707_19495 [Thiohalomonadales bacterium]
MECADIMGYGTMLNIFAGKGGAVSASYNLSSTEFSALSKALIAIPKIQRARIEQIARLQRASHWGSEGSFWEAMFDGCH